MLLALALLGCSDSVVLDGGNNVVSAAPGTDSDVTSMEDSAPPNITFHALVNSPFVGLSTTSDPWVKTYVAIHLAVDSDGELLTEQPVGDFQPEVTITMLTQLAACQSHNGVGQPPSTVAGVDNVSIQVTNAYDYVIYDKTQIVQGVDVIEADKDGNVLGHMQWQEGNADTTVTFNRCDGCEARDPP